MASISKIFLSLRRRPGTWCLWTWAILDSRHQCVPLTRANSRCVFSGGCKKPTLGSYIGTTTCIVSFLQRSLCLFSPPLRSLLQPVTQSWEGRTLTRSWLNISVRNLARSTSSMSCPSPELWSGSTRSARNWRNLWAQTPPTCRSTSSASWMTLMSLENWTGRSKKKSLAAFSYFNLLLRFTFNVAHVYFYSFSQGLSLKRCALIFLQESRLHCRVCWNIPVSIKWTNFHLPHFNPGTSCMDCNEAFSLLFKNWKRKTSMQ